MGDHANIELIRDAYAAFVRGDIDAVLTAMALTIEWHIPGPKEAPYVGSRRGIDEVAKFFAQVAHAVEFTHFEPREYFAADDRVVVLGRYAGSIRSTGKPFAAEWTMAWTVRNGKAVSYREYTDTQALGEAFR
jgi:ketosteroid isomerase-like protein